MYEQINSYISKNLNYLVELDKEICRIPSPTGEEEHKGSYVKSVLESLGVKDAFTDEAGNVIYVYNPEKHSSLVILAAHIDTVFAGLRKIEPVEREERLFAPSIWDNSINVAGLILVIRMIRELGLKFDKGLLFAFNVGEEGFGNLKGIKKLMEDYKDSVCEVIAVDGGYSEIVNRAVGSKRYVVSVKTEGGHSWGAFGNDNAILYAAKIIEDVYKLKVPAEPKTTYNAGLIKGGTSVNTIAEHAEITFDFRSEDRSCLAEVERDFFEILGRYSNDRIHISAELLGERPCGMEISQEALSVRLGKAAKALGIELIYRSGSTDANIPLSMGIPAVALGIAEGGRAHTSDEYLELGSLEKGMRFLSYLLLDMNGKGTAV